jgi:threonine 3-dehydrogenase
MAKLVSGGTGYVGSETVRQLVNRGEQVVVFDIVINHHRIEDVENKVKIVRGDLGDFSEVLNLMRDNKIDAIYHMGAMLTHMSELNPWTSFRSNVLGTYHILEAARLFDVPKMVFTSSVGTFGLGTQGIVSDTSLQRPITLYGCGKLYGEGLGRWYASKFGLDFRSVRYPQMISPGVHTPGHWAPPMIEDALTGRPVNDCIYGSPETATPMIYVADAAKAAVDILDAPRERIRMMNYNVAGIPDVVPARELETFLKTRHSEFGVNYKVDPLAGTTHRRTSKMTRFDDSFARKEWGWSPAYSTLEAIVSQFDRDLKAYPSRYGSGI